ncbi:MAG TPA: SAM-dependent methyltransferase, partial [Casimicrobiaceae bacterium]|nr:SAM-dependent methyltransferase [Casimicrobiaceae bacterium]
TFDAVVVVNYLHRPTFAHLLDVLGPAGTFIYETFAQGNERHGRPRNPDFLLAPHELLERTHGRLRVVAFEQGEIGTPEHLAVVQRIAGVGWQSPWPPALPDA